MIPDPKIDTVSSAPANASPIRGGKRIGRVVGRIAGVLFALLCLVIVSQLKSDLPFETLRARYATGASRFTTVDGMNVHYRDEGSGPTVVLMHGTGASLHTWDAWAEALRDRFRVVRFDLPGFGLTGPRADGDYSMRAYAAFVEHTTSRLGLEQFAIFGNSFGGEIAWNYTLGHRDRVWALGLIDAAGYPVAGNMPIAFRLARVPILSGLLSRLDTRRLARQGVRASYGDPSRASDAMLERYYELGLREGNRAAFVQRMRTVRIDRTGELHTLAVPTLIQWGRLDRLIPVATASRFERDIPGATVRIYDDLGHIPMEEAGARTAADARAFLLQHTPP
jgi:pimeloyl-ACP methyl ester carboxylesterase